ncbi:MAG: ABC transporter permease, partial [Solirubrobacterales bacterium]
MAVTNPRTLDDLPHGGFGVGASGSGAGGRPARKRPMVESMADWRWGDRIAYVLCWAAGLGLCLIAALIVGYMAVRGVQYLKPSLLWTAPSGEVDQSASGGFLDPILGTILLTIIGIVIATPLAVAAAIWVVEYGRPKGLARAVESGIEVVAGTPDIVLAIFGLALFQHGLFGWLSFPAEG